ncbi:MAG: hypothetical protein OEQ18_14320 [Gammaproteobacteria bacterium]|nr:hypothetical protein [Gammaproteobacteria bacterium]
MKTRRRFLFESSTTWLAMTAAPVALISCDDGSDATPPAADAAQPGDMVLFPGVPLSSTRTRALELLNSRFNILYDETNLIEAELVEVNSGLRTAETEEFTFLFRTTWEPALQEAMYDFEHPELGRFPLYIARATRPGGAHHYAVTVNHLLSMQ